MKHKDTKIVARYAYVVCYNVPGDEFPIKVVDFVVFEQKPNESSLKEIIHENEENYPDIKYPMFCKPAPKWVVIDTLEKLVTELGEPYDLGKLSFTPTPDMYKNAPEKW